MSPSGSRLAAKRGPSGLDVPMERPPSSSFPASSRLDSSGRGGPSPVWISSGAEAAVRPAGMKIDAARAPLIWRMPRT